MSIYFLFSHLSSVLGNKFDHGAEAIVPVLFNLIPNCAKVMATSGVSAIRIIIRVSISLPGRKSIWYLGQISRFISFVSAAHPRSTPHPSDNQQLHVQVCGCKKVKQTNELHWCWEYTKTKALRGADDLTIELQL